jgi:hypothetical protein
MEAKIIQTDHNGERKMKVAKSRLDSMAGDKATSTPSQITRLLNVPSQ